MSLITLTDAISKESVAVNPSFVVAVFTAPSGEQAGKTVLGLTNGNMLVDEYYLDVVGQIQGQL